MANAVQSSRNTPGDEPLAYFLTFTCYGTWLHGDERGSIDPRRRTPGTAPVTPNPARESSDRQRQRSEPMYLDQNRRAVANSAIRQTCTIRGWTLHALNVRTNHVHIVLSAAGRPEPILNSIKAWCTRRMVEAGVVPPGSPVWTRHGSTRYLWTERDVLAAAQYVAEGQGPDLG